MTLNRKILVGVLVSIALLSLGAVTTVYVLSVDNREEAIRQRRDSVLRQAEIMQVNMDRMYQAGAFDTDHLIEQARRQIGGEPLRQAADELDDEFPIVAAPGHESRNPENDRAADHRQAELPGLPRRSHHQSDRRRPGHARFHDGGYEAGRDGRPLRAAGAHEQLTTASSSARSTSTAVSQASNTLAEGASQQAAALQEASDSIAAIIQTIGTRTGESARNASEMDVQAQLVTTAVDDLAALVRGR